MSSIEHLGSCKVLEVVVVRDNLDLMQCTFHVPSPVLEAVNYGKKFLVMGVIVDLGGGEFAGVECYWVQ